MSHLRVDTASAQLISLLDDLLAFVRIHPTGTTGREAALRSLIDPAMGTLWGTIASRGIIIEIPSNLPSGWGDPTLLQEVFQHLLDKAIKFLGVTPEPRISVHARRQATNREHHWDSQI